MNDTEELPCTKCGGTFAATEFYAAKRNVRRAGRHSWCKTCVRADLKRRREQQDARARAASAAANRLNQRRVRLARYGLTIEGYERLFAEQGGACAICRKPEVVRQPRRVTGAEPLAVDHCHRSGKVRGLLCMKCNTAIGKLNDDPALLRSAAAYLEADA